MKYCKTVKNRTARTFNVGLLIRRTENTPFGQDEKVIWCELRPGDSKVIELADQEDMPFLNGLSFRLPDQGEISTFRVDEKSGPYDDALNKNHTIHINGFSSAGVDVVGENPY